MTLPVQQPGAPSTDAFVSHDRASSVATDPTWKRTVAIVGASAVALLALTALAWMKRPSPPSISSAPAATLAQQPTAPRPAPSASPEPPPCLEGQREVPVGVVTVADGAPTEVAAFCLDAHEVTAAQYAAQTGVEVPRAVHWRTMTDDDHRADVYCTGADVSAHRDEPINCVDWSAARAFCQSRGGDLPTEAQWTRALQVDGTAPWGSRAAAPGDLNACGRECVSLLRVLEGSEDYGPLFNAADAFPATAPVGRFSTDQTRNGVYDLAGNVREWTLDLYAPGAAEFRVVRGGSWKSAQPSGLDLSLRGRVHQGVRDVDIGFRCASPQRAR